MNIPKHIITFIELCPAKSRQTIVFATYTHMSGETVDTKSMSKTDAELWRQALGILQPILVKREKARLYRQRRRERLMHQSLHQKADQKANIAESAHHLVQSSKASAVPAISENSESSDSIPNTSQSQRYYKPGDIEPGEPVPLDMVDPKQLRDIRDLCQAFMPSASATPTGFTMQAEKIVQDTMRKMTRNYFSHLDYDTATGQLTLYAAAPRE